MAVATRRFAERDQVAFLKLQFGVEMKWPAMMNLQLHLAAAYGARRKILEVLLSNGRPMRRTRSTERMLALSSIYEMANDGHKKARSRRAGK